MTDERPLPLLLVDFSKDPDYNVEITDAKLSKALGGPEAGWSAESVRAVTSQHGIFNNIPIRCVGRGACPYKDSCPIAPGLIEKRYKDNNCPVEIVEAYKLFAGYVISLDIKPEDFSDLQLVGDLVRLLLLARRCDLYNKDKPIWENEVSQVDKLGNVHCNKVPILTFPMMNTIRKDIQEIYKQLIATREAKVKRDAAMKDVKGATDLFSQLKKAAESYQKQKVDAEKKKAAKKPELPSMLTQADILEADFKEVMEDGN